MSARSKTAPASADANNPTVLPEPLRLACWRLAQLLDAGYEDAEAFAGPVVFGANTGIPARSWLRELPGAVWLNHAKKR